MVTSICQAHAIFTVKREKTGALEHIALRTVLYRTARHCTSLFCTDHCLQRRTRNRFSRSYSVICLTTGERISMTRLKIFSQVPLHRHTYRLLHFSDQLLRSWALWRRLGRDKKRRLRACSS